MTGQGIKLKKATPDGFGENRYDLINKDGEQLGYIEYSLEDDNLIIDYVRNTTKGTENRTPNVAEKLMDKVISENPNKKIVWDAISDEGIAFKERYLSKHPELKNNISGINDTTLARQDEILYNKSRGNIDAGKSNSNR